MSVFSFENYRRIIENFMQHGYEVRTPIDEPDDGSRVLYLRHDVDYTLVEAVNLARVNAELGVSACFYLPVSSPIINLHERSARAAVDTLRQLGQRIGLHFYLPDDFMDREAIAFEDVKALIAKEFALLEVLVGGDVHPAMSWHNPGVLGADFSDWIQGDLPGLSNAYAMAKAGIAYRADSNLRYSVDEWLGFAESGWRRLQVLIHPFQWSIGASRMEDILREMFSRHIRQYDALLAFNDVYSKRLPGGLRNEDISALFARLVGE